VALQEEKARRAAVVGGKSLVDELDALADLLAARMDSFARRDLTSLSGTFCQEMVVILPCGRYPLLGVVGYRKSWPCYEDPYYCRERSVGACWPEILGVKPWEWPWQPYEPVRHGSRKTYVRGFILSFAVMEKAAVTVAVHVAPRYVPHNHYGSDSGEHPASRSAYFAVTRGTDGALALESITWAAYRKLCSRAAQAVPELAAAQEKSAQEAQKFAIRQH